MCEGASNHSDNPAPGARLPEPSPYKNLQTTIHRGGGGGGGGVAGGEGGVSSPQFSQPYFSLAAELLSCAT